VISLSKKTKYLFKSLEIFPKITAHVRLRDEKLSIDGSLFLVDISAVTDLIPNIIVFFVGEIDGLVGVQAFRATDLLLDHFKFDPSVLSVISEMGIEAPRIEGFTEFIGTIDSSTPYFAICAIKYCVFSSIDLFNNAASDPIFFKFDSNYPGIKNTFCPKWIKSSTVDYESIFMLSDCGNGDYALY